MEGVWVVDGVPFPDEPRVWLSNVIGNGLDPRPTFDVHAWDARGEEQERKVAVVQVDPVATPPCMVTSSGQVYQRLPGKTELVSDASVLASLFARGERARDLAEQHATEALRRDFEIASHPWLFIHVVVAPVGGPEDSAGVLFREQSEATVIEAFENLSPEPLFPGHRERDANFTRQQTRTSLLVES